MLKRMVAEKWLTRQCGDRLLARQRGRRRHRAVTRTRRASHGSRRCTRCASRWRARTSRDRANTALADFVAPKESGLADYIGGFAVTTGIGEAEALARHIEATDDYSRIMLKALADRLAEAFAERMHERVRREFWGYAAGEKLTTDGADRARSIAASARRRAIRPSPTTPRRAIFRLLDAEAKAGIELTESFAMWPGSAVSGLYFSHPESHYFGVGKVERDQVEDYARAQGLDGRGGGALAVARAQLRAQASRGSARPDVNRLVAPLRAVRFPLVQSRWERAGAWLFGGKPMLSRLISARFAAYRRVVRCDPSSCATSRAWAGWSCSSMRRCSPCSSGWSAWSARRC